MKLSDYYYELPSGLIAQQPCENREKSRLLLLDKTTGRISHDIFENIHKYLNEGDCLFLNDTKVIPARLFGKRKDTGSFIEFVLLKDHGGNRWEVLTRPGRKALPGKRFVFGNEDELEAVVTGITDGGNRIVEFVYDGIFMELVDRIGTVPLPPYIKEKLSDMGRYQTVYAVREGSAAAPTAGLHFTEGLIEKIKGKGIDIAYVTLHIGLGTFRPVKTENIEDHKMHSERFTIKQYDCDIINKARAKGSRIVTVGTTSCRALESAADADGFVRPYDGDTDIFIYPGYKFKITNELITNFHLPGSTLLMLVSALASRGYIMDAYETAIKNRYRFFSFGDAMFIYDGERIAWKDL